VVHSQPPQREKVREILGFRATEANADKIVLEWSEPDDVKEYRIYWDRSNNETRVLQLLTATKTGKPLFNLDHQTSAGIMGSDYLEQHGGSFRFQLSFVDKTDNTESPRTSVLKVDVPAMYAPK